MSQSPRCCTLRAAASVRQDIVLIAGKPRVEPVDQAIERRREISSRYCVPKMPTLALPRITTWIKSLVSRG